MMRICLQETQTVSFVMGCIILEWLYMSTNPFMLKLLQFKQSLRCQKLVIDKSNEGFMPEREYLSTHGDSDIIFRGVGLLVLNQEALAKYQNKLVMLDEIKIRFRDAPFWREFKRWGYNLLKKFESEELSLPQNQIVNQPFNLRRCQLLEKIIKRMKN